MHPRARGGNSAMQLSARLLPTQVASRNINRCGRCSRALDAGTCLTAGGFDDYSFGRLPLWRGAVRSHCARRPAGHQLQLFDMYEVWLSAPYRAEVALQVVEGLGHRQDCERSSSTTRSSLKAAISAATSPIPAPSAAGTIWQAAAACGRASRA